MSNFFTPEFNNESAIAPWNASLEPTKAIIPKLDANPVLTGGIGQEVNIPTLTPEAYDNIILPDASLTRMASAVSTDSNTSLPDSSVDLLTGQAMSEVYGDLSKFAADPDLAAKLNVPFGVNWDAAAAKTLAEAWFQGDFSDIPPVKVVSSAEIGGANGAFAEATDTIYLSKELLAGGNLGAIADVLREEIGHSVDSRLNVTDSPGDEGAIFGAVVQGKELSQGELQGLRGESDQGTVLFNGQAISIEKAEFDWQNNWAIQARNFNINSKTWEPVLWSGRDIRGFGSNNRSDGKKGFAKDWGDTSPVEGVNKDKFWLQLLTQADFQQGQTYNFKVRADDSYALNALPVGANNANQWEPIGDWKWNEDAFGGKTVQFTPKNSGKYWVLAYYVEKLNDAYFDISWDKVNGSSYISGLSSLTDDQWDQQSGDGNQFDGNNSTPGIITKIPESSSDVKQVAKDLSKALFGIDSISLGTGYAYDYTTGKDNNGNLVLLGYPYNGDTKAHAGIDYQAGVNQTVSAIVGGTVKKVTSYNGIGKFVTVDGDDGKRWIYGHIENSKQEREPVSAGEKIGTVVSQVNAQGNNTHFHLEVDSPPFKDSIIGGIIRDTENAKIKFVRDNTMSPLQAYWKYRNNIK